MTPLATEDRYKMSTVVRLTGFTPALLRAWERRHGVLEPDRCDGGHRLYTPDDLAILRYLKSMKEQGRSIGEMARLGRAKLLEESKRRAAQGSSAPPARIPAPAQPEREQPSTASSDVESINRMIVEGAVALDGNAIDTALDHAFSVLSPPQVIHQVIEASALQVGDLWSQGLCTVASEHFVTELFMARLRSLLAAVRSRRPGAPQAVLSCFPDEQHELGLLILGYHFSTLGWKVTYLGAALPFEDFEHALRESGAQAAVLSVATSSVYAAHRPKLLALLRRMGDGAAIFIGGQGSPPSDPEVEEAGGLFCPNGRPVLERIQDLLSRAAARQSSE